MIQCSMTGYGKGEVTVENKKITVELRTLNGKQLDLSMKMPSIYRKDEFELRSMLSKGVVRGKCDMFVNVEVQDAATMAAPINFDLFSSYYKQISELGAIHGFESGSPEMIQSILRMPEVVSVNKNDTQKNEVSEAESQALKDATSLAIVALKEFRVLEGKRMEEDILSHIDKIESLQVALRPYEPERVATVRKRIEEGLESLKVEIDSSRLEQELIFYIEKYDINEEMVRLKGHIDHFRHLCATEPMCGRKLGFLSQELGREINTTGSKANHTEIQKIVVEMKDELEKIKEQSLNLL